MFLRGWAPHCGPETFGVGDGQTKEDMNYSRPQRRERQRQNETSECNCPIFPS